MQGLRSLITGINDADSRRQMEGSRFVEEQKIRKALAPTQWEALKLNLKKHCEAVNRSSPVTLKFREDGINDVFVANVSDGREAELSYISDVPCITYKTPVDSGHFPFRVSPDGTMVQLIVAGIPRHYDDISVTIISQITG
jgi:hypothetical protein